ncbi:unnamed protein product, partial [Effrenium voratum]
REGAAARIQAQRRGCLARREVAQQRQALSAAVTRAAALFRGRRQRAAYLAEQQRRLEAATRLQALRRGHVAREQTQRERKEKTDATVKMQAAFRGQATRKQLAVEKQRREEAATKIQAIRRGNVSRQQAQQERDQKSQAATRIQAVFRGKTDRKRAAEEQQKREEAATKIQAIRRGNTARQQVTEEQQKREEAATKIQAIRRGNTARQQVTEEEQKREEAATKIQAIRRGNTARQQVTEEQQKREEAATKIQAIRRGNTARQQVTEEQQKREEAATKIQAIRRGNTARQQVTEEQQKREEEAATSKEAGLAKSSKDSRDSKGGKDGKDIQGSKDSKDKNSKAPDKAAGAEHSTGSKDGTEESLESGEAAKREEAATKLQAIQRGNTARQQVAEEKKQREQAATKIQAIKRGNDVRKDAATSKETGVAESGKDSKGGKDGKDSQGSKDSQNKNSKAPDKAAGTEHSTGSKDGKEESLEFGEAAKREEAATKLQAIQRGNAARQQVAEEKKQREQAATKIQAIKRGNDVRKDAATSKETGVAESGKDSKGGKDGKDSQGSKDSQNKNSKAPDKAAGTEHSTGSKNGTEESLESGEAAKREEAATKLQAIQRGNTARQQVAEEKKQREQAATKIQAIKRGNDVRKDAATSKETGVAESGKDSKGGKDGKDSQGSKDSQNKNSKAPDKAAGAEHSTGSKNSTEESLESGETAKREEAATKLQAIQRGNTARQQVAEEKKQREQAATKIQAIKRGNDVRKDAATSKERGVAESGKDSKGSKDGKDSQGSKDSQNKNSKAPDKAAGAEHSTGSKDGKEESLEFGEAAKREEAATKLQAIQRGNAARQQVAEEKKQREQAATKIQAIKRGNDVRKEASVSKTSASFRIPAAKGKDVKDDFFAADEAARRQEAATKLQALQRGKAARQQVVAQQKRGGRAAMRRAEQTSEEQREEAATKIQAARRGASVRKELAKEDLASWPVTGWMRRSAKGRLSFLQDWKALTLRRRRRRTVREWMAWRWSIWPHAIGRPELSAQTRSGKPDGLRVCPENGARLCCHVDAAAVAVFAAACESQSARAFLTQLQSFCLLAAPDRDQRSCLRLGELYNSLALAAALDPALLSVHFWRALRRFFQLGTCEDLQHLALHVHESWARALGRGLKALEQDIRSTVDLWDLPVEHVRTEPGDPAECFLRDWEADRLRRERGIVGDLARLRVREAAQEDVEDTDGLDPDCFRFEARGYPSDEASTLHPPFPAKNCRAGRRFGHRFLTLRLGRPGAPLRDSFEFLRRRWRCVYWRLPDQVTYFATHGPGLEDMEVEDLMDSLVPLDANGEMSLLKYNQRLQLSFSETRAEVKLQATLREDLRDISGSFCLSDGCGSISLAKADEVAREMGLEERPGTFQARCGPFKGLWVVDPALDVDLVVRPSQLKYHSPVASEPLDFEVLRTSTKPMQSFLTSNSIQALEDLGVSPELFVRRQQEVLDALEAVLQEDAAEGRRALEALLAEQWLAPGTERQLLGFLDLEWPWREPNFQDCRFRACAALRRRACEELRLPLRRAHRAWIVPDHTRQLQKGECFLQLPGHSVSLAGREVLLIRSPCYHSSSVLKLRVPSAPEGLQHLVNVVVLNAGERSGPADAELMCGDHDGDTVLLIWDEEMVAAVTTVESSIEDADLELRPQRKIGEVPREKLPGAVSFFLLLTQTRGASVQLKLF